MKVLIINTSERAGGAAVASRRLKDALSNNGLKARMLVAHKETDDPTVVEMPGKLRQRIHFLWERWCVFWHLHFQRDHLFELDLANAGTDITTLPAFREADVIQLEWINQGMLSLSSIRKILRSGKPVVWTLHDLWPATGICHVTLGCRAYMGGCHRCKYLPQPQNGKDLAARIFNRKKALYEGSNIHFIACSKWLGAQAKQSGLLKGLSVACIPNPIDTQRYKKMDKAEARRRCGLPTDKRVILFVSQRVTLERKGIAYFAEAIALLTKHYPSMQEDTVIAILGGHADEVVGRLSLPSFPLGYVSDEEKIVEVYNAADLFVIPSLDENLPNTIMESMACGVPCVGFKVGGIPEMIDHRQNGYVAQYRDAEDLARGIHWVMSEADYSTLSQAAIEKVRREYSQRSVAMRYIEVYNQALAYKKCGL